MKKRLEIERFIEKISHNLENGCWEWSASVSNDGYGFFKTNGRNKSAHRMSYEFFCSEIPDGLHVLHKCDNPRCVKPSHLFLGTDRENKRDMVEKKRQSYGSKHWNCKIRPEEVVFIRSRLDLRLKEISQMFGVSMTQASRIRRGIRWKYIE